MALTTLTDYKAFNGITGTANDTALGVIVTAVNAKVARYIDRTIETGTFTEFYSGTGGETLRLKNYPITSITSVEERDDSGSYTTLASGEYRFNAESGLLFRIGARAGIVRSSFEDDAPRTRVGIWPCWAPGFDNYRVVYVGGFATVPADLQMAIYTVIDEVVASRGRGTSVTSESIGAFSYTLGAVEDAWKRYESLFLGWRRLA
jgi:hypothetical protein